MTEYKNMQLATGKRRECYTAEHREIERPSSRSDRI